MNTDAGTSSSNSSFRTVCSSGVDPIKPIPSLPFSVVKSLSQKIKSFSQQLASASDSKKYVALIDETCAAKTSSSFSQKLLATKRNRGAYKKLHAYEFSAGFVKFNHLLSSFKNDDCLIDFSQSHKVDLYYTPNDSQISSMPFLDIINAKESYDIFYAGGTGNTEDIVVAVIDSGVDIDHEDLVNVLWTNPGETANGSDDDSNGYVDDVNGYNFASDISDPNPQVNPSTGATSSHGTHVAGLIGAESDNSKGITGTMGKRAKIMALNVFGPNASSSPVWVANAIIYAADNGADVINLSLGGEGAVSTYKTALEYAVGKGVTVFVAAGNSGLELTETTFFSPASYGVEIDGVITIGSLDAFTIEKSGFSNYSSTYVELMAPGSDTRFGGLLSTVIDDQYDFLQGTSMASPVAAGAGAIAIGLSRSRGANPSPAQIEALLLTTAIVVPELKDCVKDQKLLDMKAIADAI